MQTLDDNLYSIDSVVQLEQIAINQFDIPAYELMKRAGEAVFSVLASRYPLAKKILLLCGAGNNAGDGYVVAKLAQQAGLEVYVVSLIDPLSLKNEALLAYNDWSEVAINNNADISTVGQVDIVIDALLGTGLTREVSGEWKDCIAAVNDSDKPVISIDIPSGLLADTGAIAGVAIKADVTVSFIGLKQGMFTAQAKDVCGDIIFNNLGLPAEVYSSVDCETQLLNAIDYSLLPKRAASSHKGRFGHVLIVGGNAGMPGAVILAARAALRTGAGLVTIITVPQNLQAIISAVPEAMVKTCDYDAENSTAITDLFTQDFIKDITHVAIGMGLGQDDWSLKILQHCAQLNKPMVIDADALNLIASHDITISSSLVITPHPGEAARLLSKNITIATADVQKNRFDAVKSLYRLFENSQSCIVILKGSGTLIFDGQLIKICNRGNAAMSAPGMGDVLSGIVIALMAQDINISDAAALAVCLHASAAELVIGDKTRGLLASDVIDALPKVLQ
jgi:NAD(P)H-hydrate epimerase